MPNPQILDIDSIETEFRSIFLTTEYHFTSTDSYRQAATQSSKLDGKK